jgi:hypothetical protein
MVMVKENLAAPKPTYSRGFAKKTTQALRRGTSDQLASAPNFSARAPICQRWNRTKIEFAFFD